MAGEPVENENRATCDGVPTRASTKVSAACLSWGSESSTEPDRSSSRATSRPQALSIVGLVRESCHTPPEASRCSELSIMKSLVDE